MADAKIGKLNKRIRFLRKASSGQDPTFGKDQFEWTPLVEVWANVQDVMPSRDEALLDDVVLMSSIKSRIRFRWRDTITADMRVIVLHSIERTMEIIGGPVEIAGRRRYMEILCEEISSNE